MTNSRYPRSLWRIFRVPLALAVSSTIGLVSALVGDNVYDILSWIALAIPLAAIYVTLRRPRSTQRQSPPSR